MADLNANKVDDMLEALNRAIEIHTKNAVQGLPYNKSELVEIVDITERNLGKYIVWNGSARYQAFSENTTYEMGTKVYVNIPNDDFKEQKHIIGPYVADGESAVFYKNPLTDFQPLTGNILQDGEVGQKKSNYDTTYGLVANYNKQEKIDKKEEVVEIYRAPDLNGSGYQGYKYIGISADFKTLLNTFSPIAGDYGIVVTIWHAVKYDVQEDAAIEKRDYFLSVKDMIGNVYNFNTYFKQAALYDISAFGEVQSIIVGFYQRGNFIMSNNKEVPTHYTLNGESHLLSDNILVRNVSVTFGDDLMEDNDRATIFTRNGSTYDPVQEDILNTKTIELRWTHLNSTSDEFENLDSSKASSQCGNYKIHWYEDSIHDRTDYTTKAQSETDNAEAKMKAYKAWDKIETNQSEYTEDQIQEARLNLINTFNLKKGTDYTLSENGTINFISQIESRVNQAVSNAQSEANRSSSIAGDTLAGSGWKPIDVANTEWSIDFTPNYKRSYSKVMAIVEYDEGDTKHKIKSNILQFDNLRITSNSLSDDKASALRIGFSDGTGGDYPIYNGTTGELLSREDVTRDRKFQATCKSLIDNKDYLNGNETIIWQIPKTGSMILMNQIFLEENSSTLLDSTADEFKSFVGTLDYDVKYYYIKRSVSDSITAVNNEQTYQIAPYYNKANTNNTIYCYIIKNSDIFKGSASLTFGQHGTSGTDYTFTLGFIQKIAPKKDENNNIIKDGNGNELWGEVVEQGDTALTIGDENYLEIGFELFNSKNEKIDLTPEQKNAIIKLWVDKKDSENKASIDGFYSGLNLDKDNNITGNATKLVFITTKDKKGNYDRVAVKVRADIRDINELRYIVLQAAVTSKNVQNEESTLESVKFVQLLPIHVRAAGTDWILRGSDYIVYDDKGANPSCYNDYYQLIGSKGVKRTGFEIYFGADISEEAKNRGNYPQLIALNTIKENINGEEQAIGIDYKLQPSPLYIEGLSKNIAITHEDNLYTCPLVILQNKYQIPAINNWNGELTVDDKGNKILAAMMGAGHKNGNNTFTGVLMGDIVQKSNYTNKDEQQTGLFGYDDGSQVFGFNTNGEAYIGKSDVGRIYINGKTGRITSSARESYNINIKKGEADNDPRGTEINLKDNYIDIQAITLKDDESNNQSRIHIDSIIRDKDKNGTEAYFSIDNNNGKRLINIANNDYYLQTDNYSEDNKTGLKLDLKQGILNSYDKITIRGNTGSEIYFGNTNDFIKMGINENNSYFQMEKKIVDTNTANATLNSTINNLKNVFNAEKQLDSRYRPITDEDGNNITVPKVTDQEIANKKISNLKIFEDYCDLKNTFFNNKQLDLAIKSGILSNMQDILDDAWIAYDQNRQQMRKEYLSKIEQYQQYSNNINNIAELYNELQEAQNDFNYNIIDSSKRVYFDGLTEILGESNNYLNEDKKTYNDENIEEVYEAAIVVIYESYNAQKEILDSLLEELQQLADIYVRANNEYIQAQQNLAQLNGDPNATTEEIQAAEQTLIKKESNRTTALNNYTDKQEEYDNKYIESNIENLLKDAEDEKNEISKKRDNYLDAKERLSQAETNYNNALNNSSSNTINELKNYLKDSDKWKNLEKNDLYLNNNDELVPMAQNGTNVNNTSSIIINFGNDTISYDNFKEIIRERNEEIAELTNDCSTIEDGYNTLFNAVREYRDAENAATNGTSGTIIITNQGEERIKVGEKFSVYDDGNIKATGGNIGGWTIGGNYLKAGPVGKEEIFLLPTNQSKYRQVINGGLHTWWRVLIGYQTHINIDPKYHDKNPEGTAAVYKFGVNHAGEMFASAGNIGGWTIASGWLSAGDKGEVVGMNVSKRPRTGDNAYNENSGKLDWAFVAGASSNSWAGWDKAPFRVSHNGKLYATAGKIGGWTINSTSLSGDGSISGGSISGSSISGGTISGASISGGSVTAESLTLGGKKVNWTSTKIVTGISDLVANLSGGKWLCSKTMDCVVSVDFDNKKTTIGHFASSKILDWPDPSYSYVQTIPTKVKVKLVLSRVSATVLGAVAATDSSREDSSTL